MMLPLLVGPVTAAVLIASLHIMRRQPADTAELGEILIEDARGVDSSKEYGAIRSYKGFDKTLYRLRSGEREKFLRYIARKDQTILQGAKLWIGIHNKHASVFITEQGTDTQEDRMGWYDVQLIDIAVFRMDLAFRTSEHADYSVCFAEYHVGIHNYRLYYVCSLENIPRAYAENVCYLVTPKQYLELRSDCLEFAKAYCKEMTRPYLSEQVYKTMCKLLSELCVTDLRGFEVASRNARFYADVGLSFLGRSRFVNYLMVALVSGLLLWRIPSSITRELHGMTSIFIARPNVPAGTYHIRSYENFDRRMYNLLDGKCDPDRVKSYILDEQQDTIDDAGLCLCISHKHAYVSFMEGCGTPVLDPGWYTMRCEGCKEFRIELGYRTWEKEDFAVRFTARKITSTDMRVFYLCRVARLTRRYAEMICYGVTPKFYAELQNDCLEFAKSYCKMFIGTLCSKQDADEYNRLLAALFVTSPVERVLRHHWWHGIRRWKRVLEVVIMLVVVYATLKL